MSRRMSMARWDVLDSIRSFGMATMPQICTHTGRSRGSVWHAVRTAEAAGLIVRCGVTGTNDTVVWRLTSRTVVPEHPPAPPANKIPETTYAMMERWEIDWHKLYSCPEEAYAAARQWAHRMRRPWPPTTKYARPR